MITYESGQSTGKPFTVTPYPYLDLIKKALRYSKELRIEFLTANWGITEPLTPRARRNHQYLLIREYLMRGCREASKHVLDPYKRSPVYGILVSACDDIFHLGYKPEILAYHNSLLDRLIGTH